MSIFPRIALALAVAYGLLPIDAMPDFLPGIGLLDDAAVIAVAAGLLLRAVLRARRGEASARARAARNRQLSLGPAPH